MSEETKIKKIIKKLESIENILHQDWMNSIQGCILPGKLTLGTNMKGHKFWVVEPDGGFAEKIKKYNKSISIFVSNQAECSNGGYKSNDLIKFVYANNIESQNTTETQDARVLAKIDREEYNLLANKINEDVFKIIENLKETIDASNILKKEYSRLIDQVQPELDGVYAKIVSECEKIRKHTCTVDIAKEPRAMSSIEHIISRKEWREKLNENKYIQDHLVIDGFLLAVASSLITGSIVLLNGSVGIGKTSLVKEAANIFNGFQTLIPVRPAWLDPADLLGFFDPINETFRPGPLSSALLEKKHECENIHLICLDELNLARIENYGSDLLSQLEYGRDIDYGEYLKSTINKNGGILQLYSYHIYAELKSELENIDNLIKNETSSMQNDYSLQRRFNKLKTTIENFNHSLYIPLNMVLIGTLNTDQTTYDISPKVIDRSFVLAGR